MLFTDPHPRVVVVPPGRGHSRGPLRLLLLAVIVITALVYVAQLVSRSTERTVPHHGNHHHTQPDGAVRR